VDGLGFYRRLRFLNRIKVHHLVYLPTAGIIDHGLAAGTLCADIRERLANGFEGDFYDAGTARDPQREDVAGFAALYKLLPLIPAPLVDALVQGHRVRLLRRVPAPAMAALQGLAALRSGDLRFAAYLSLYPAKVAAAVAARLR
jgi:anaerobic magnesium-protoporphyrin IX monomethyl ester cyclase